MGLNLHLSGFADLYKSHGPLLAHSFSECENTCFMVIYAALLTINVIFEPLTVDFSLAAYWQKIKQTTLSVCFYLLSLLLQ